MSLLRRTALAPPARASVAKHPPLLSEIAYHCVAHVVAESTLLAMTSSKR